MTTGSHYETLDAVDPRDIVWVGGRELGRWPMFHLISILLGAVIMANALIALGTSNVGFKTERDRRAGVPVTRFVPLDHDAPRYDPTEAEVQAVVVLAHGYGNSQRSLWPFAATIARNGYAAETLDLPGHGGAGGHAPADPRELLPSIQTAVNDVRLRWPGKPVVLLGDGWTTTPVVDIARNDPAIAATILVAPTEHIGMPPRNLLALAGSLDTTAVRNATALPNNTSGRFEDGTARRVAIVPLAERLSIAWHTTSLREIVGWLDRLTATQRTKAIVVDVRLPAVVVLILGALEFWWSLLFFVYRRPEPAAQPWGASLPAAKVLAGSAAAALVATLLLLPLAPRRVIPSGLGAYLPIHIALFGVALLVIAAVFGASPRDAVRTLPALRIVRRMLALVAFVAVALGPVAQYWWFDLLPPLRRGALAPAIFVLLLPYAFAEAWLAGSWRRRRTAWAIRGLLLGSLVLAGILHSTSGLLTTILPLASVLMITGLFGDRLIGRTGNALPATLANAAILAWLIASAFPLIV